MEDDEEEEEVRPLKSQPRDDGEEEVHRARQRRRRKEEYDDEEEDENDEEEGMVARVIPYHNKMALVGYYCAIFALIPMVVFPVLLFGTEEFPEVLRLPILILPIAGVVLGGAGLVLGIVGLVHALNNPRAKGGGHAGTALFLGMVTSLMSAVCWILYAAGILPMKLF